MLILVFQIDSWRLNIVKISFFLTPPFNTEYNDIISPFHICISKESNNVI